MSDQSVTFVEGFASRDSMPYGSRKLHVHTIWACPSQGYRLRLEAADASDNPQIVVLRLIAIRPRVPVAQVITPEIVTYTATAEDAIKEVTIIPAGVRLPVLEVDRAASVVGSPAVDGAQTAAPRLAPEQPNFFELTGVDTAVTYSTTSIDGTRQLSYSGPEASGSFSGDRVRAQESELGHLVTVYLDGVPDLYTRCFTLIVPAVNLIEPTAAVNTVGLVATHRTSIGGPALVNGQLTVLDSVELSGTARSVRF